MFTDPRRLYDIRVPISGIFLASTHDTFSVVVSGSQSTVYLPPTVQLRTSGVVVVRLSRRVGEEGMDEPLAGAPR